jgi:integrase
MLLEEARALGLDLADLIAADTAGAHRMPNVRTYIEVIAPTFTSATAATYRPYWRLAAARLGERRLVDITVQDLVAVVDDAVARAQRCRPDSTGRASRESCVAALRALFRRANDAGLITVNPAAALIKPRRVPRRRRALDDHELAEVVDAIRTTSRDPDLDLLLMRFHLESGARREGALNLRRRDLDPKRATVWLREKAASEREQPVSPSLVALLVQHADARAADDVDGAVFRTRTSVAISARRYDTIFDHARTCLEWADRTPVSAHVLRHTAITAVGRLAGYPVAQAFAGHSPPTVTGRYLHATIAEVAGAIATLTGETHPLADRRCRWSNTLGSSACRRR